MREYKPNNGLTRRWHPFQIIGYIVIIAKVAIFTTIILPANGAVLGTIFAVLYYILVLFVLYFGGYCTLVDTTDDLVIATKKAEAKGETVDHSQYEFYCDACKSCVQNTSKHCWRCNRCVNDFDHHCKWVNNCISKKNYKQFIALLICIALAFFVYIAASLVFIIRYSLNSGDLINHVIWYFSNPDTLKSGFIVTCVFCGIMVLMAVLDLNLLVYHIWLIKNKLTTYEHIIMKRKMEITRLPQEGQFKKNLSGRKTNKRKVVPTLGLEKGTTSRF